LIHYFKNYMGNIDKIKLTLQSTAVLILASTLIYLGNALTQIGNQLKEANTKPVGGLVATSQETLGSTVSSTIFTASSTAQTLLASTRVARYFLAVCNNTSTTIFIAPTTTSATTPFENKGIPVITQNCYEFSQGKGNLYTGPVAMASSSAVLTGNSNGNIYVVEKSR